MARVVGWLVSAAMSAALSMAAVAPVAAQAGQAQAAQTPLPPDPEAVREPEAAAAVVLSGETVLLVPGPTGPYTAEFRAGRISQRLLEAVHDRSLRDPTVTVTEVDGSSELRIGPRLLMVVTQHDAAIVGVSRVGLATQFAREIETAIRAERLRYEPGTLVRSGIYGLVATIALALLLWIIGRLTRWLRGTVTRFRDRRLSALRVQQAELVSADSIRHAIDAIAGGIRLVLILLALDLYLTFVLGLFPWTRAVSFKLLEYVLHAAAHGGRRLCRLPAKPALRGRHRGHRDGGQSTRRAVLQADPVGAHRLQELSRGVGRPDQLDCAGAADCLWRHRCVSLSARLGLPGVHRRLGVHRRAALTGIELLAVEHDCGGSSSPIRERFASGTASSSAIRSGTSSRRRCWPPRVKTIKNEMVVIPNGLVLGGSVTNYTRASRRWAWSCTRA